MAFSGLANDLVKKCDERETKSPGLCAESQGPGLFQLLYLKQLQTRRNF
jgi:hypothetical protein